jgi:hypothetical protein
MRVRSRSLLLLVVLGACEGKIVGGTEVLVPDPSGVGGGQATDGPPDVSCDPSRYGQPQLATIAADFVRDVYPALNRQGDGCVACHAPNMGRMFKVTTDGTDTFYQAQMGGFFDDKPGTLVDRLTTTDALARMPKDGKAWPKADIEAVARIACEVKAYAMQGGTAVDEQFPPNLLTPFTGTKPTDYENTFINMVQLQGRVKAVFADDWVRGGTNQYLANIGLFGGADFVTRFNEVRTATSEFLLGLDKLAPDVCTQAVTAKTGPFTGFDLTTAVTDAADGGTAHQTAARAQLDTMYQRMLYRPAATADLDAAYSLLKDLSGVTTVSDAWEGVCEGLVRHPDFLFTVAPATDTVTGAVKQKLLLVKLGLDLLARPPTAAEFATLASGASFGAMVDAFVASPDFKTYYFNRMRLRTESSGTDVTDEPARLWTHLALTGKPFTELFTADYLVDTNWAEAARPPEHGKSGLLTMQGYLQGKQGLPHFNYSARVFTDFMGKVFEVPPEVFAMRGTATAASTVDPTSICFNCHQILTPLAYQRLAWADDGTYRTIDPETMQPIDDTDRGLVATYPFKGKGMEAFATQAVKKEAFIRAILQSQHQLLLGRDFRWDQDERGLYKQLWDLTVSSSGDLRAVLKAITLSSAYQRVAQ